MSAITEIQRRRLGKSGLEPTVLGFGGISIQSVPTGEAVQVIRAALDAGINFFDSARVYTDSEAKMGAAFRGRREECLIATKSLARSAAGIRRDLEASLAELETDHVELFQLHNISTAEELAEVLAAVGALEGVLRARDEGLCGHVGITSHNVNVAAAAVRTGCFETLQIPYNIIEDAADTSGLFRIAEGMDVGVIIMKPLAGGALDLARPALRFALHPLVTTVIPGMASRDQVAENVAALAHPGPPSAVELQALRESVANLGERFCRRCQYCLPCPQGINIPQVFICATTATWRGEPERARSMYERLMTPASDCTECGECEERCPYLIPIREMLAEAVKLLEKQPER